MTAAVQAIALADATAGMVLAEALHNQAGSVLLPAGATLTSTTLNALRRRGIESLGVLGEKEPDDGAARAAERERQCARLARLFRNSAELGATGALLARLYLYRRND
jgi:hypothetical protein